MNTEKQSNVATRRSATHQGHRGLTLVELLVTITIMGLVIAISIPVVKPMMATNKVKNGADLVAGFLAQARNRAMEENRPVGVTFERILNYEYVAAGDPPTKVTYPYNGACVVMRQVAEPKPLSGFVKDVRVTVDCSGGAAGRILFHTWLWDGTAGIWKWDTNSTEESYWDKLVEDGDQVQFDAQGPKYTISKSTGFYINPGLAENSNLPWPVYTIDNPVLFKVFRKPQPGKVAPTMVSPVMLPEGIVVDLDSSGMDNRICDAKRKIVGHGGSDWTAVGDDFCAAGPNDTNSVTIMFSPVGDVDKVYYSKLDTTGVVAGLPELVREIPAGPIFLNIGIWERAGFWAQDASSDWHISNDYLPEEAQFSRNYHDLNNYWVTIFPQNGTVRVNRLSNNSSARGTPNVIRFSRGHANSLHGAEVK